MSNNSELATAEAEAGVRRLREELLGGADAAEERQCLERIVRVRRALEEQQATAAQLREVEAALVAQVRELNGRAGASGGGGRGGGPELGAGAEQAGSPGAVLVSSGRASPFFGGGTRPGSKEVVFSKEFRESLSASSGIDQVLPEDGGKSGYSVISVDNVKWAFAYLKVANEIEDNAREVRFAARVVTPEIMELITTNKGAAISANGIVELLTCLADAAHSPADARVAGFCGYDRVQRGLLFEHTRAAERLSQWFKGRYSVDPAQTECINVFIVLERLPESEAAVGPDFFEQLVLAWQRCCEVLFGEHAEGVVPFSWQYLFGGVLSIVAQTMLKNLPVEYLVDTFNVVLNRWFATGRQNLIINGASWGMRPGFSMRVALRDLLAYHFDPENQAQYTAFLAKERAGKTLKCHRGDGPAFPASGPGRKPSVCFAFLVSSHLGITPPTKWVCGGANCVRVHLTAAQVVERKDQLLANLEDFWKEGVAARDALVTFT